MAVKSGGGGDENIGRRLSALLSQSGLEKEDFGASYELHENSGPSSSFVKEIAVYINVLNTRIRDQVLDSGWATEQEIEQALEGARQFANDPNAVQARATCHVVGRKAA